MTDVTHDVAAEVADALQQEGWSAGFARWKNIPIVEGMPRYGYVLDGGFGPVGVILLISDFLFSRTTAIVSAAVCAVMFAYLWFGMALIRRAGETKREPERVEDEWPQ